MKPALAANGVWWDAIGDGIAPLHLLAGSHRKSRAAIGHCWPEIAVAAVTGDGNAGLYLYAIGHNIGQTCGRLSAAQSG
jgi:hypothetical protein